MKKITKKYFQHLREVQYRLNCDIFEVRDFDYDT